MSERDVKLLLGDIIESGNKIFDYVKSHTYENFISDNKTIDAVVRNFEIIGEATNKIPENYKVEHPHIQWNKLKGLRNRIVHDYFGVDLEIIWNIIQLNLPTLLKDIEKLLN
jgi:uncharacterized protein with HEPN domain